MDVVGVFSKMEVYMKVTSNTAREMALVDAFLQQATFTKAIILQESPMEKGCSLGAQVLLITVCGKLINFTARVFTYLQMEQKKEGHGTTVRRLEI